MAAAAAATVLTHAAVNKTLGAVTTTTAVDVAVVANVPNINLGAVTLNSNAFQGDLILSFRGIMAFVYGYQGDMEDQIHSFLLDKTVGTNSSWSNSDLWLKFYTERGYSSGTIQDRTRNFLIDYTGSVDIGQTVEDLWMLIDQPYTP